jgi:PadR family transcriptional regulator, regulatory protein PadR
MRADAVRGHLDGLLLAVLDERPLHGYAVIEAITRRSGGALDLPTGTVYPALNRLERTGLLRAREEDVGGRRRRTYALTPAGRRALTTHRRDWTTFTTAIASVLRPEPQR